MTVDLSSLRGLWKRYPFVVPAPSDLCLRTSDIVKMGRSLVAFAFSPAIRDGASGNRGVAARICDVAPRERGVSARRRPNSPGGSGISPRRRGISPRRRDFSLTRSDVVPERPCISPRRRDVSLRKRTISPGRQPVSGGSSRRGPRLPGF